MAVWNRSSPFCFLALPSDLHTSCNCSYSKESWGKGVGHEDWPGLGGAFMSYDFLKTQTKQSAFLTGPPVRWSLSTYCIAFLTTLYPFPHHPQVNTYVTSYWFLWLYVLLDMLALCTEHPGSFSTCDCSLISALMSPCDITLPFIHNCMYSKPPLPLWPDSWAGSQAPDILRVRLSHVTEWMEQGTGSREQGKGGCEGLWHRGQGREAVKPVFQWTTIFFTWTWKQANQSKWISISGDESSFPPETHTLLYIRTQSQTIPYHIYTYILLFTYSYTAVTWHTLYLFIYS